MSSSDIGNKSVDAGHIGVKRGGPSIGLVLGSGAARGFAHIGVMRALHAHGIKPDIIVGTSMGALVGGCYATNQLDALEAWARSLTMRRIIGYLDVKIGGSGLISGGRLATELQDSIGDGRYRGTADPLRGDRNRDRHRPRSVADARLAVAGGARVLCAAGNFSAGSSRRPLAGRRRAGQSGAGIGGARARRPRRHRGQHGCRPFRPRHDHREPRLRCRRRRSPPRPPNRRATGFARLARHVRRRTRAQAPDASPTMRGRAFQP